MGGLVELVVEADALLGEGPVWDAEAQTLYWLDIKGKRLHSYDPQSKSTNTVALSAETGVVAPARSGGLIAARRDGFGYIDPQDGSFRPIADPEADVPDNRFNDGCVDPKGNFVAGSMDDTETSPSGQVYRLDPQGNVQKLFGGYVVCNGPAFSPDGRTLYFSNSDGREILAFPYGDAVGAPTLFATFTEQDGYPDGLCVDRNGHVWVGHWDGGRLTRYNPDGEIEQVVELPVPRVTCAAFGGPDLDTLYITSARVGMSADELAAAPLSGSLFAYTPETPGLALAVYAG